MDLKKTITTATKVIIPLAFGVLLIWLLYREMDLEAIMTVIKQGIRYEIILFSLIFGLLANITRAYRWGLLIESIGSKCKKSNLIYSVLGTYALNLLFIRIGEIWRCGVIAKYEKVSFTKLIGTLLIDRISDTIAVGTLTLIIFFFNIKFFKQFLADNPELLSTFQDKVNTPLTYTIIILIALLIWFVFRHWRNTAPILKTKAMLKNVWEGIQSIGVMKKKRLFIIQTILIWLGYYLFFYITFYAFDFTKDLGPWIGLITFVMSSIAIAAPVQGGLGAWHFMVIATLGLFGVSKTDAAAFALVVWTIQNAWTGMCGIFGVIALPIVNKAPKNV